MNTWALLKNGKIVNTVTTTSGLSDMAVLYPGFEVADIYSLPANVQEAYQFWSERP